MDKAQSKYFQTAVRMDDALIALLDEKDFPYITIKEICQRAGVNRSTFYLHYENTRDLLEETVKHLIDQFFSYFPMDSQQITARFQTCRLEDLNFISAEYLIPYLTYIRDNRKIFSIALANSQYLAFDAIYRDMFRYIFRPILDRFRLPEAEQPYVMAFYLNGINAIMLEWVHNDCQESIDCISGILVKCILGKLQASDFSSAIE